MTIQPSVTIWTVLCFTALYFILRKLLFEPLLQLMDARQQKIDAAAAARQEAAQLQEAALRLQQEQQAARLQEARLEAQRTAEQIRLEGKQQLEAAKRERITAVEACRTALQEQTARDLGRVDAPLQALASRFLQNLYAREP